MQRDAVVAVSFFAFSVLWSHCINHRRRRRRIIFDSRYGATLYKPSPQRKRNNDDDDNSKIKRTVFKRRRSRGRRKLEYDYDDDDDDDDELYYDVLDYSVSDFEEEENDVSFDSDFNDDDDDEDFFDTRSRLTSRSLSSIAASSSASKRVKNRRVLGELPDESMYNFWSTNALLHSSCLPYCTWRLNDDTDKAGNGGRDILLVRMGAANSELSHENKQKMDQVMVSTIYHGIKTRLIDRDYRTCRGQIDVLIDMKGCSLTNPPPFDVIARGLSSIGGLFYERAKVHRIGNPPRGTQILINAVMILISKDLRDSVQIEVLRNKESDDAIRNAYEAPCLVCDSMK